MLREVVWLTQVHGRAVLDVPPPDRDAGPVAPVARHAGEGDALVATDPASADFMNFREGSQPLVDTAFLAQAILRAPKVLWEPLEQRVKQQVIDALKRFAPATVANKPAA